jgi:4-amino-4-deoxy-L-arabinose transferase-like glycosyltransferase
MRAAAASAYDSKERSPRGHRQALTMSEVNANGSRQRLLVAALLAAAFLARLGARMAFGEEYFWTNSYGIYYELAENVLIGKGFCFDTTCAWLPPLYPLFLTLSASAGKNYLLVVVPQALMGAGTAFCAFLIGRHIFNATVGVLACAITAFYPYYVMHDTALQETGMVTFCTALSVWLLLRASRLNRNRDWVLAGLVLGSIALVRASVAPAAGVALLWTAIWGAQGNVWARLRKSSILLLAVTVIIGPWLIRTYHLTGTPVLNSQNGQALWTGNNSETFSYYPAESIDRSRDEAWSKLTQADQEELARLANDEITTSNWFAHRAWVFIRANPWLVVRGAFRKLEAGFSPRLNPVREPLAQAAYAMAYVPVAVLGIIGMLLARQRGEVILIEMLFLAFMCVTAIFWAHTSHRSYLDVYWIVFAASVIDGFRTRFMWGSITPFSTIRLNRHSDGPRW